MVVGLDLGAGVGDDVHLVSCQWPAPIRRLSYFFPQLTHHVAPLVLPALLVGQVSLDPEMEDGEIFDAVLLRLQSPDDAEALAVVDIVANGI